MILKDYPLEAKVIRKHALMLGWKQAVRLIRKHYRMKHARTREMGELVESVVKSRDGGFDIDRKTAASRGSPASLYSEERAQDRQTMLLDERRG
jgi:hypothetical protein